MYVKTKCMKKSGNKHIYLSLSHRDLLIKVCDCEILSIEKWVKFWCQEYILNSVKIDIIMTEV